MTTSPILGLDELAASQAIPEATVNENNRWLEFFASGGKVLDRGLTAPPGSPADGDAYLVASSATGAWAGQDGKIALRISTAWAFKAAREGMLIWVADEDVGLVFDGAAWGGIIPFDVPLSYAGGPPTASEILYAVVVPRALDFAANFAGSYGYVGTNPTASFVISVQDDGAEIGTITISTGGAFTFATASGTAKTVAAGSRLEFVAPAGVDATVAYVLATLAGLVG